MSPRLRLLAQAWLQMGLVLAIGLVLNHLVAASPKRFDVTSDQRHSLSATALDLVSTLDTPLTATVWFTKDLGPPYHNHRQALMDLLTELEAHSAGQLDIVVRDPTGQAADVAEAQAAGIRPITWTFRDWDQTQARQVWMGVSLEHGRRHAAADALPDVSSMEHDLVQAMLDVTTDAEDRKTVGWLQGNGEPTLANWGLDHPLGQLREQIGGRHNLRLVAAHDAPIPEEIDALLVVGPQLTLSPSTQWHLDQYLMNGGAIAWFVSSWQPDFQKMALRPVPHDLAGLLGHYGVQIQADLLVDRVRNEPIVVPVHGQLARVNHPLAPVTAAFDRRLGPTRALTRAVLPFASQVRILDNLGPDVIADVWLSTEKTAVSSRRLTSLALSDLQAPDEGESAGPHAAMVGLQGVFPTAFVQGPPPLPGGAPPPAPAGQSAPTRMLVAGSADMVANNVDLVLNGLDWLLSDPRLVSIRGRTAAPEPVAAPQPDRATTLKLAMGGSPLLLLALLGALVGWRNRRDH